MHWDVLRNFVFVLSILYSTPINVHNSPAFHQDLFEGFCLIIFV
jgi:hypothetical protein